jgi:hypothetical protein
MMSNTGCTSVGDSLITFSTSVVAVCRSSASFVLVEKPDVLDRDHRLVGEVCSMRPLASPNGRTSLR